MVPGQLDDETKRLLIEQWLPHVRALRDQRRPYITMMLALIILPVVIALLITGYMLLTNQLNFRGLGGSGLILGVSAIAFVYLGKLQSCNDTIIIIEGVVMLGDRDQIIKSISMITCLGKMQDLLREIRPLVKGKL